MEIVRVHYLMNNRQAIVSECDEDTEIEPVYLSGLTLARRGQVAQKCIEMVNDKKALEDCRERALSAISKLDSAAIIREILSQ